MPLMLAVTVLALPATMVHVQCIIGKVSIHGGATLWCVVSPNTGIIPVMNIIHL